MNVETPTREAVRETAPAPAKTVSVKIFGVGTAGIAMLDAMAHGDFPGAGFVAVNTGATSLAASSAVERVCLESKLLRGLGTGGDPERGRELAEAHAGQLKSLCADADVVFIVAGLGGGAGTGISPVLARAAKEAGALVMAFVTLPFECEGNRRHREAQHGLEHLKHAADGVICLPDQKIFKLIDENASVADAYKATTHLLIEGVRGVWRLVAHSGLIEIHFEDLCAVLRDRRGESCFAAVEAAGTTRSRDAMEKLLAHPLLDGGARLAEADAVVVSLMGGPDLTMADVNRVMEQVNQQCQRAQVIMGAAIDDAFRGRLSVMVIATHRGSHGHGHAKPKTAEAPQPAGDNGEAPDFDTQFLENQATGRPASRFVPPAPALTPEQREQLLAKQTGHGGRGRKGGPRMKQGTLPLEIVTKGRFDKTEPTVHKGEDLDLPTFIRRGVVLN